MPTRDSLSAMSLSYDDSITQVNLVRCLSRSWLLWLNLNSESWLFFVLNSNGFLFFYRKGRKPILILRTQLSVRVHSILGNYVLSLLLYFFPPSSPAAQEWWLRGNSRHLPPRWRVALSWEDFLPLSLQLRKYSGYFLHMKWSSGLEFYSAVVLFVEGAEHRERLAVAPLKLVYRDQRCPLSRLLEGWKSLKASWF